MLFKVTIDIDPLEVLKPEKTSWRGHLQWILAPILTAATGLMLYYQGPWYGLATFYVSLVAALLVRPGWRWFYIAMVTTPRDTK